MKDKKDSDPVQNFHKHLDVCSQCRNNPFALCSTGSELLKLGATNSCDILRIFDNQPKDDDDWKLHLHNGDEITIDSGQPELPPTIIIQSIEYFGLGSTIPSARILTQDGEKIECLLKEIF